MAWRMAKSLDVLLTAVNALSPKRSKASDGGIGNAEHASRSSDHNPWVTDNGIGVVTARDFTHDPAHGIDSEKLANALLASRDPRIKYVISNRKIASGNGGPKPWAWRKYNGSNPHDHHCHVSVKSDKANYDNAAPWSIDMKVAPALVDAPEVVSDPLLKEGARDADESGPVHRLQALLNTKGFAIAVDGVFGIGTKAAVMKFQKDHKLVPDGVVGSYTWKTLKGE